MAVREAKLPRNERVMAKGWIQGVVLVSLFGFTVLGFMAARPTKRSRRSPTGW